MENVESFIQIFVHIQNRSNVTASVAVVWSRPDCDEVLVFEPILESIHDKLMRSGNQGDVVDVIEFSCDFRAEQPSCSSWRHGPSFNVFWIRPHKIAEWTLVRNFHSSVDKSHLVDSFDFRRETTMDAEDLAFDHSSDSEVVENFSAVLPRVGISVFSNGLVVEAIDGGDLSSLVVSSEECDMSWVLQFEAEQELESLNRVETSVNKISHENVSSVWDLTAFVEKFQKVVELTMDISTDCDWSFDWLNVTFFDQNFFNFLAEDSQFSLWKNGAVFNSLEPRVNVG